MQLGFRVPLLVISPYAKRGYVDDAFGEFSSPLRFIADNWGLPHLTPRIADSHDFSHVFDFDRPPRRPDPQPATRGDRDASTSSRTTSRSGPSWMDPEDSEDPLPVTASAYRDHGEPAAAAQVPVVARYDPSAGDDRVVVVAVAVEDLLTVGHAGRAVVHDAVAGP